MSGQEDSADKQYDPTPKRLEDARKKGDIARSADLTSAAAYLGFFVVATTIGGAATARLGGLLMPLLDNAPDLATDMFSGGGQAIAGRWMGSIALALAPVFGIPALFAIGALAAQRAFVFAPDKLRPRGNRLSPIANARNRFGRQGLFEFAKSFVKLGIYGTVLGIFLARMTPRIAASAALEPATVVAFIGTLAVQFMAVVAVIAGVLGLIDYTWQRADHLHRNRMSRKEMTDEAKQSEGDPHMRQERQRRAHQIATNQMLADVPAADVVIVNPTHFAVALKWSRAPGSAPVCVAKGVDEIAARIRAIALENGVPVQRDPATARALHASVDIGEEIRPEHYRAVAAAIRFAEEMRKRARSWATRR